MLQLERINDREEALRVALDGFGAMLWTALPGIVESYNAANGTCSIQPAIQAQVTDLTGAETLVNMPLLINVPVVFMGGGNFVTTYPITPGDEALVIFCGRCIDAWWQSGGVQAPAELRTHDLSDGIAIIGPRSLANSIPNVSTTTAQFRTLDGSAYFELAEGHVANIVAPGGLNITGNVMVTGTVIATQEGTFNSIEVSAHQHTGVQTGSGDTGPPIG